MLALEEPELEPSPAAELNSEKQSHFKLSSVWEKRVHCRQMLGPTSSTADSAFRLSGAGGGSECTTLPPRTATILLLKIRMYAPFKFNVVVKVTSASSNLNL
jgi:hypothetical protein